LYGGVPVMCFKKEEERKKRKNKQTYTIHKKQERLKNVTVNDVQKEE
jgi:hypothetical protein